MKGKPFLPNLEPFIAAGINPKTGLPVCLTDETTLKADIKRQLREIDLEDCANRYVWYNLPSNLSSQELEKMLYYYGQLCFFYYKDTDEFYFLPYTLDHGLDLYRRYVWIHPVPPVVDGDKDKKDVKAQASLLENIKLKVAYAPKVGLDVEDVFKTAVILYDRSKQRSEYVYPRQKLNDPLLDVMAECPAYMRTALIMGSGVKGVRVNDTDQYDSVAQGAKSMKQAALEGMPYVPIVGNIEFQELTDGATNKAEEYMLAMQSLDNFRLSTLGLDNGGLFEKKAHELQSEADINGGPVGLVLQDGLSQRQNFCNIVNSVFGLGIWCEPAQNVMGADINGDGLMYDRNDDGTNSGVDMGGADNDTTI